MITAAVQKGEPVKIPFGKHKGKDIDDVPSGYLRWLVDAFDEKEQRHLILAAEAELRFRSQHNCHFED